MLYIYIYIYIYTHINNTGRSGPSPSPGRGSIVTNTTMTISNAMIVITITNIAVMRVSIIDRIGEHAILHQGEDELLRCGLTDPDGDLGDSKNTSSYSNSNI